MTILPKCVLGMDQRLDSNCCRTCSIVFAVPVLIPSSHLVVSLASLHVPGRALIGPLIPVDQNASVKLVPGLMSGASPGPAAQSAAHPQPRRNGRIVSFVKSGRND
jgi:hypothetical protein